jgi:WD40 repeat protein
MSGHSVRRVHPFFDEAAYRRYLRQLVMSRRRIVYAVEFDGTGTHLAAGNSAGHLNIFDLKAAAAMYSGFPVVEHYAHHDAAPDDLPSLDRLDRPKMSLPTEKGPIYSLFTNDDLLYCGADTGILVYRWDDLVDDSPRVSPRYTWVVSGAGGGMHGESVETNAITGRSHGAHVYAATGLGSVDCFDAATFRFEDRFKGGGVGAYLHCIAMRGVHDDDTFVTGGDDGAVRVYDRRAGKEPQRQFDMRKLTGARQRAWVGCVATDTDGGFVVCGDGNRNLTSVHLSSGCVLGSTSLDYVPNALVYRDGELYCGGADKIEQVVPDEHTCNILHRYDIECNQVGTSPVSSSGVYALASHPQSKSMAASGYSTRHRWHDAAELIDVYVAPPVQSFTMFASECMRISPGET